MFNDFSKYNEEELLNHIDELSKKLLTANPNYPAYRQLQSYLDDARFEYGERIQVSIHQKEIDEGPQTITIGEGEMEVGPEPVPEEIKQDLKKTAMKKLLAQAYVYNNKK
jgi:hypothetical protein|tara:strand:+ start:6703 stop:7032 length:330 start_codon:yes stop_codon:yes gene_type:complete